MMHSELEKFVGGEGLSVAEAMRKIDRNASGVLILIDAEGKLSGTLTDGDVRRFLL